MAENENQTELETEVTPEPSLRCPVCGLNFDSQDQLDSHVAETHDEAE